LTRELIQGAIDAAAKSYLGDPDVRMVVSHREYLSGSTTRELCDKYLHVFAEFRGMDFGLADTIRPNKSLQPTAPPRQ
jgi:hypothetical protein